MNTGLIIDVMLVAACLTLAFFGYPWISALCVVAIIARRGMEIELS